MKQHVIFLLMRLDVKKIVHCASESAEHSFSIFRDHMKELTISKMITNQTFQERRSAI